MLLAGCTCERAPVAQKQAPPAVQPREVTLPGTAPSRRALADIGVTEGAALLPTLGTILSPPQKTGPSERVSARYCVTDAAAVQPALADAGWSALQIEKHPTVTGRSTVRGLRGAYVLTGSLTEGGCPDGVLADLGVHKAVVEERPATGPVGGASAGKGRLPEVPEVIDPPP